jgi:probable F420-dependent oxidoreductase
MDVAGVGIWNAGIASRDPAEVHSAVAELEELGYASLWIPGFGSKTLDSVDRLLSATTTVTVATGILNVWVVPAADAAAGCARLRDAHGDRFLLGLGASHESVLAMIDEKLRYERPLGVMNDYLDRLDTAPTPVALERRVLAALGPKMLDLAARRAGGAHPYNVTPDHTASARAALGPGKVLIPEQAVTLTTRPEDARRNARTFLEHYLELPNYTNNLRRLGFTDDDLANGGSDRLVDALVAWGDEAAIAARVQEHLDAGADGVCIQVVSDAPYGGMTELHRDTWRALAPALTGLAR